MCSWFKTGYEASDTAYDDLPSSGPSRVWMPEETTRRFLFLEDDPCLFWEHQFQANGSWRNWEPCKTRNRMENVCAVCDRFPDRYASYIGYHTVVSLTPWEDDKGRVWCFGRQMYGAKLGGKDKPGVLKKLRRIKDKHGQVRGLVIDAYRSGKKTESVGDELEVVEVIEREAVVAWVKSQLPAHIDRVNQGREPGKELTLDRFLKSNPIEPFNFEEIIKPRSNAELLSILGGPSMSSQTSQSSGSQSGSKSGSKSGPDDLSVLDEDIPY